jgi:hypothetical protein
LFPDAARPNTAHVDDPGTFKYVNAASGQGWIHGIVYEQPGSNGGSTLEWRI